MTVSRKRIPRQGHSPPTMQVGNPAPGDIPARNPLPRQCLNLVELRRQNARGNDLFIGNGRDIVHTFRWNTSPNPVSAVSLAEFAQAR